VAWILEYIECSKRNAKTLLFSSPEKHLSGPIPAGAFFIDDCLSQSRQSGDLINRYSHGEGKEGIEGH
jgi:hypothetical protein